MERDNKQSHAHSALGQTNALDGINVTCSDDGSELELTEELGVRCSLREFPSANDESKKCTTTSSASQKSNAQPTSQPRGKLTSNLPRPPVAASVVLEECNGKTIRKVINAHVGVPQSGCPGIRKLKVQPFSFVERDQQAWKLREEKRQKALEESYKFPKFTANPLPSYLANNPSTKRPSFSGVSTKKEEKENDCPVEH